MRIAQVLYRLDQIRGSQSGDSLDQVSPCPGSRTAYVIAVKNAGPEYSSTFEVGYRTSDVA